MTALAAIAACDAGVRVLGPGRAGGETGGTGAGGTGSIVGTWRAFLTFFDAGDTIVSETRWTFAADGTCFKLVTHTFVNAGVQDTIFQASCTYTFGGSSVTVTFAGSSVATTFSVVVSGGDLLLDGTRYTRLA